MRTLERQSFLCDVLVTFAEGRTGSWFSVRNCRWYFPDLSGGSAKPTPCSDGENGPTVTGTLRYETDESEGFGGRIELTPELVEKGLEVLAVGKCDLNIDKAASIIGAGVLNDAGSIDADDADIIIQAAVYGEVVYG